MGLPLAVTMLPLTWWMLTRWVYPVNFKTPEEVKQRLAQQRKNLGTMTSAEARVGVIFTLVALAWMTRPLIEGTFGIEGISDAGIAMLAALSCL